MKQFFIIFSYVLITSVFLIQEKEYAEKLFNYASTTVKTITCVHSKFTVLLDGSCNSTPDVARCTLASL